MYFTSLPKHNVSGFDEQLHFRKFKKHNIIFNAKSSRSHCDRHVGCLSMKTVLSGEEWYGIGNLKKTIRPGQFLILNDDQEYSSTVDTSVETNVVSIFFMQEFASSVFRDVLRNENTLLENPFESGGKPLEFFQTLYDTDPSIQKKLLNLINSLEGQGYETDMVNEQLFFLLSDLVRFHKIEVFRVNEINAVKPSTRMEIYKRICIVKDFLHSNYMERPSLSDAGTEACLSVPQLIRQFKTVYNVTPHQYLTRIRLVNAARLLKHTSTPVHEITWMCGFENVSAFCRAFKSSYGVQPSNFRKN
jgi:AraC family transcriptional regulator